MKQLRFHGALTVPNDDPSQFAASISFHRWDPTALDVELLWIGSETERRRGSFTLPHLGRNHVMLESIDPLHSHVELLGIDQVQTSSVGTSVGSSLIRVAAIQAGLNDGKLEEPRELQIIVRLQPSGIFMLPTIHGQHYTGEITVERVQDDKVHLQCGPASLEAAATYEYDETEEHGDKVTKQVQRASLMGTVRIEAGQSLFDVHEALKEELAHVCTALSLCARQVVDYYEVEYMDLQDRKRAGPMLHRRRWSAIRTKAPGDELINTRAMVEGGLQRLIDSIHESPHAVDLRRAIGFLAASFTASVENAFFMAFSAMETVVACCVGQSEQFVVGASRWKKVQRHLSQCISDLEAVDAVAQAALREKLPELRRVSLASRLNKACQEFGPKTADLWPNTTFEEGMKRATSIRNGLFHAANATVEESLGGDLIRLRTFTERLMLKFLGWPDESIWTWYDQDLKWVNQGGP